MFHKIQYLKNRYIIGNNFVSHVFTVMSGTMIAQAILFAIAPILTRLYSPSDFGIFALYTAIVSLLSVIATGRYELAIILPESNEDAFNIFVLTATIIVVVSLVLTLIILFCNTYIASMLKSSEITNWLYFIPLSIFIMGFYQTINNLLIYKRKFRALAANRICQSGLVGGMQAGIGFLGCANNALIPGQIIGQSLTVGLIGAQVWKDFKPEFKCVTKENMLKQAKRYKKFPKYSLLADFINMAANQVPNFILNHYFGMLILGFYALAQRVVGTPVTLIAFSLLEVFKERASRDYRQQGSCRAIYIKTFTRLLLLAIIPLVIFFLAAPKIFIFIFGKNWQIAGEYARILSIMFFFKFISSPLGYVLYIAEKQNYDLCGQILLFIFAIASIAFGSYLKDPKQGIIFFSLSYSLVYILYLIASYYFTVKRNEK